MPSLTPASGALCPEPLCGQRCLLGLQMLQPDLGWGGCHPGRLTAPAPGGLAAKAGIRGRGGTQPRAPYPQFSPGAVRFSPHSLREGRSPHPTSRLGPALPRPPARPPTSSPSGVPRSYATARGVCRMRASLGRGWEGGPQATQLLKRHSKEK